MNKALDEAWAAYRALDRAIGDVLNALHYFPPDDERDQELDYITAALCARSHDLEDWLKGVPNEAP